VLEQNLQPLDHRRLVINRENAVLFLHHGRHGDCPLNDADSQSASTTRLLLIHKRQKRNLNIIQNS
jgi:hypothetical protein